MKIYLKITVLTLTFVFSVNILKAKEYVPFFFEVVSSLKSQTPIYINDTKNMVLEELPKARSSFSGEVEISINPCYLSGQGPRIMSSSQVRNLPDEKVIFDEYMKVEHYTGIYLFLRFTSDDPSAWNPNCLPYWHEDPSGERSVNFLLERIEPEVKVSFSNTPALFLRER